MEVEVSCPYCGEINIMTFYYMHDNEQTMIEDCIVCCKPMELSVKVDKEGNVQIEAKTDSE